MRSDAIPHGTPFESVVVVNPYVTSDQPDAFRSLASSISIMTNAPGVGPGGSEFAPESSRRVATQFVVSVTRSHVVGSLWSSRSATAQITGSAPEPTPGASAVTTETASMAIA